MSLLDPLAFGSIGREHLDQLVVQRVPEGMDLEFKEALYGGADKDRREFLKDVTALANTAGGHLVIGVREDGGAAAALAPVTGSDADGEKQRLENMLLASVEPRLVGVQIREIPVDEGYVLLLRVPRSWNPPHRVTFGGWNKYFLRNSGGAYEPSVDELRAVFLGGAEAERRLTEFRLDRLARLRSGGRGVALHARGQLLVQTVPLAESGFALPSPQEAADHFPPLGASNFSWRHNLEGLLIYSVADHGPGVTTAYTQVFRDGRVEIARGGYVRERRPGEDRPPVVASASLATQMIRAASQGIIGSARHRAAFPMALMVSFLDAEGTWLSTSSSYDIGSPDLLDRRDLLFAPVLVEAVKDEAEVGPLLLPVLDALWNAYGHARCDAVRDGTGAWRSLPPSW